MVSTNYMTTEEDKETAIKELERLFDLNADQLKKITQLLQNEMKIGLNKNDEDYTNIPMLPSWITRRPTGQELGEYLGLDLSRSHIRVYLVTLHGHGRISTRQMKYTVKQSLKKGSINKLVDFMAECVDNFLNFINKTRCTLFLGLCISFPLHQTAINNAYVLRWTKDFEITGAYNKNIVELLQTSFRRREIPVVVKAAVNGARK
ncbi:hypothetical protein G6F37_009140 [Rhizopus arrhizus]|nr:hypothetical protein G6F38_012090 [Rhizopus arrhizus]KAG1154777.1 hypothetical protein G6F37_009140 [Rhizopus arrhizus]